MKLTRRSFFAAPAAPFLARFAPKPKQPVLSWLAYNHTGHTFYTKGLKIGDTIMIRKPPRYIVKALFDLEPLVEEREPFVIQNEHDLKLHGG